MLNYTNKNINELRPLLELAYTRDRNSQFRSGSGIPYPELKSCALALAEKLDSEGIPRILTRARVFAYLLDNAEIGLNPAQYFADGFNCEGIMQLLRADWQKRVNDPELSVLTEASRGLFKTHFIECNPDYGHLCPDWNALLTLGLCGILSRLKSRSGELYEAGIIYYEAIIRALERLADEAQLAPETLETAANLRAIAERPPETLAEALQLIYVMFRLFEYVDGERIRSLGGLDRQLWRFYKSDLTLIGTERIRRLFELFFIQAWSMRIPFDLPMYIGGVYSGDNAEELAELIVSVYTSLDIYSPKIHVRVADSTGDRFLKAVLDSIRRGNSSFIFISDETAVKSLVGAGISREDAIDYVPIGCYEPAAFGKEIPCTGNGHINIPKAIELALYNGTDPATGSEAGIKTGEPQNFEEFYTAATEQLRFATKRAQEIVCAYERHYGEVFPIPMLSATYESCIASGIDALSGGAKYNNSSLNFIGIATAADSLAVIKSVYEGKLSVNGANITPEKLREMLRADWNGFETERAAVISLPKFGNNADEVDTLASRLAADIACFTIRPNARGGVFKPGLFSIDICHHLGKFTGATPDGRRAHEPLSKNNSPTAGYDKSGVTAEILSASKLHCDRFPNGSVLDIMLHPSAVSGCEGLDIMLSLIKSFFSLGGFAIHGNVVSAETLEAAQKNPSQYANLQVRLCGWNVYFTNLSKAEQDELIRAAK